MKRDSGGGEGEEVFYEDRSIHSHSDTRTFSSALTTRDSVQSRHLIVPGLRDDSRSGWDVCRVELYSLARSLIYGIPFPGSNVQRHARNVV